MMKKTLNKALKIPYMQFYFSNSRDFPEYGVLTKLVSKSRLRQLMKSYLFLYEVKSITIKHEDKKTFIYREK